MTNTITYTAKELRPGLVQVLFENGYTLSIGFGDGHYATHLFDGPLGKAGLIPTSYELGVFDPKGDFVRLTEYDDVVGHQSIDIVKTLLQIMGHDNFDPKDLKFYFD